MTFSILPPQTPLLGADGRLTQEWYLFFLNIFQSNGSGNNTINQDLFETLVLGCTRPANTTASDKSLSDVTALTASQRSERAAIEALIRRVSDLEAQIQTLHNPPPAIDPRAVADLQTFTFGSRPWL